MANVGDVIFYQGDGSFYDRLISFVTRSKFVHVAIVTGENSKVEALASGIEETPFYGSSRTTSTWTLQAHSTNYDQLDLSGAIAWLRSMVGKPYGWSDVVAVTNPFGKWFTVIQAQRYDCSALACEYLVRAGGVDLGTLEGNPHGVTPAMLANQLGVK